MENDGAQADGELVGASGGSVRWSKRLSLALGLLGLACLVAIIIGWVGAEETANVPAGQENEFQEIGGGTGWTSLVVAIAVVFLGWAYTGVKLFGPFPKLRRHRIEIHNWISIGALGFALFHALELMTMGDFRGWLSGWVATVLMMGLFVHGWWKRYFVGLWGLTKWRVVHWEMALATLAFSLVHWLLIEQAKEALAGG